jgi:GT2 family glycosyltransferase
MHRYVTSSLPRASPQVGELIHLHRADRGWWSLWIRTAVAGLLRVTIHGRYGARRCVLEVAPGRMARRLFWLRACDAALLVDGLEPQQVETVGFAPVTAGFAAHSIRSKVRRWQDLGVLEAGTADALADAPLPRDARTVRPWLRPYERCFPSPDAVEDSYLCWQRLVGRPVLPATDPDGGDWRVLRQRRPVGTGGAGNWLIPLATGDQLADGILTCLNAARTFHPEVKVWFTDEERTGPAGSHPCFKAAFDPDRLLAGIPLGRLWAVAAETIDACGLELDPADPASDLRAQVAIWERYGNLAFGHLPQIGCLRGRLDPMPVAAAVAIVADHLRRTGAGAQVTATDHGLVRIWRQLPAALPPVTLVIPTRDGAALGPCLRSLLVTDYPALQVLVVDNGSTSAATARILAAVLRDPRVRVRRDDRAFNWSALNNAAVRTIDSDLVGLLNDDIEVQDPGWLREMVAQLLRPGTGCVGAMLLYPDGTVQHAGVGLGLAGVAGHPQRGERGDAGGYDSRLAHVRSVAAVTGACLLVRRDDYLLVGGCDEGLAVAFNDVDLCLRLRAKGLVNRWTPFARLVHHESLSRGSDVTPRKRARFEREFQCMRKRWAALLDCDPCGNPHLAWHSETPQPATIPRMPVLLPIGRSLLRVGDGWPTPDS